MTWLLVTFGICLAITVWAGFVLYTRMDQAYRDKAKLEDEYAELGDSLRELFQSLKEDNDNG
jgi:cell division protein FtsB